MPHVPCLLCQCSWRGEELLPPLFPIQDPSVPAAEESSVSAGTEGPAGLWEPGTSSLLYPRCCCCSECPSQTLLSPAGQRQEHPKAEFPLF